MSRADDYYNFNFLAPWESTDFLASHVALQNEIFLSPTETSGLQNGLFIYVEQEEDWIFSPHRKMNHKGQDFHGFCVCSTICDLEDYYSQLGSATGFHPEVQLIKHNCLEKSLLGGTEMSHSIPVSHWP